MTRLFDDRDIVFLRAEPGYTVRMEGEFRRRRCRTFSGYLRSVRSEILAAQTELEILRIESPEDYEHLWLMLLRCRMRFAWATMRAYACIYRYRWQLGATDLAPVVQRFEAIRGEIRRWIPGLS
jgi:hypothetical protein